MSVPILQPAQPFSAGRIILTEVPTNSGQASQSVSLPVSELIAYSEQSGFTRLNLTGSKILDVKETTWQIDLLVRAAASQTRAAT